MSTKLAWGLKTGGFVSDRPPDRDICSCTSAPNGHVYWAKPNGSKLNVRVGLACVIYEEGVENVTFHHRLSDECSVFQAELLCTNLVEKWIQDSLRQLID
ncbi:hypothetical protein TNCV_3115211 [Trichonephila clavipes]|nr:hypothetical protein TNCV_3115211 [Trichonephila clavipes]